MTINAYYSEKMSNLVDDVWFLILFLHFHLISFSYISDIAGAGQCTLKRKSKQSISLQMRILSTTTIYNKKTIFHVYDFTLCVRTLHDQ